MQVVSITVEFSDELLLETSSVRGALPTLSLSNGGEATIVEGTGTREWLFSYDFTGEDNGTDIAVLDIANDSTSAINCTAGCRASNWNGATANLSVRWDGRALSSERPTYTHQQTRLRRIHRFGFLNGAVYAYGNSWQTTIAGQIIRNIACFKPLLTPVITHNLRDHAMLLPRYTRDTSSLKQS